MPGAETGPAYLALSGREWKERARRAFELISPCRLCPRECGAKRLEGEKGVCRAGAMAEVASYNDHHGEEPPISGTRGSGVIFFTHCNLRCVFCQNYPISHLGAGEPASKEELARMMVKLQQRGVHNVNFVTPTHMMPFIVEALPLAIEQGFRLPLVYNCGGYESQGALKVLDGIIDVYLPDMKYSEEGPARRFSGAPDYARHNRPAILEMHRQVGNLALDDDGLARRGLIIRHMVLPHGLAGSKEILEFIAREVSPEVAISFMSQYFPAHRAFEDPEVSRRLYEEEYEEAAAWLEYFGLEQGWVQDEEELLPGGGEV